jgi:ribonuclease HI
MTARSDINASKILSVVQTSRSCQRIVAAELGISEAELRTVLDKLLAAPAVMHIDGGSRGNPGDAAIGIIIEHSGKRRGYYRCIGKKTNNEAEYQALVTGLTILAEKGIDTVTVYADSELMVKQISGKYRVKSPTIKPLYSEAVTLISKMKSMSINHVKRDKNKDADKLVNRALDSGQDGEMELSTAL